MRGPSTVSIRSAIMTEYINNIAGIWWAWMWPMFWQVSLLIVLIGLVDLCIRSHVRPQVRYILWVLVFVRLVLPVGLVLPGRFLIAADSAHQPTPMLSWQAYVMLAWITGVLVLSGWMLVSSRRLRQMYHGKTKRADLPQRFRQSLIHVSKRLNLRQLPDVVLSSKVASPAVFGVFRPVLLINISQLSRRELEHILLHELAHIKRGDLIVHVFGLLLQIIYWFNPLLWLAHRRLHRLQDLCCDTMIVRILRDKTNEYKQTILDTTPRLLTGPISQAAEALGLTENDGHLSDHLSSLGKSKLDSEPLVVSRD